MINPNYCLEFKNIMWIIVAAVDVFNHHFKFYSGIRIVMLAKSAIRHNMSEDLPRLIIPTCLVWGKQDTVTPPKIAEKFHSLLPNSELCWIDKCGHAPMMEQPQIFNSLVEAWLEKNINNGSN